jgi:hypothetical protein
MILDWTPEGLQMMGGSTGAAGMDAARSGTDPADATMMASPTATGEKYRDLRTWVDQSQCLLQPKLVCSSAMVVERLTARRFPLG